MLKNSKIILTLWILACVMFWLLNFFDGYSIEVVNNLIIFISMIFFVFIMFFICLLYITINMIKKKSIYKFIIGFVITIFILIIPMKINKYTHPTILGAMLALRIADEDKVLRDVEDVLRKNFFKRLEIIHINEVEHILPESLKKLNAGWFTILEDGIYFKKLGVGDSEGFYIVPKDNFSKGIKLAKGVYWVTSEDLKQRKNKNRGHRFVPRFGEHGQKK